MTGPDARGGLLFRRGVLELGCWLSSLTSLVPLALPTQQLLQLPPPFDLATGLRKIGLVDRVSLPQIVDHLKITLEQRRRAFLVPFATCPFPNGSIAGFPNRRRPKLISVLRRKVENG